MGRAVGRRLAHRREALGRPLSSIQIQMPALAMHGSRALWICTKRVQRVEIRIGRLNSRTVMERARSDQNIRGWNGYALGARATRQIKRRSPNVIINLQLRESSLQISKHGTLTLGPRPVPKFESDQRTPTRFAIRERTFDPSPYFFITLWPQEVNP
jgi:hypothetical protein